MNMRQRLGMLAFYELVESFPIHDFLQANPEFDRYYLACVYVLFQRASFHVREYNVRKFAMALHIVNAVKVCC